MQLWTQPLRQVFFFFFFLFIFPLQSRNIDNLYFFRLKVTCYNILIGLYISHHPAMSQKRLSLLRQYILPTLKRGRNILLRSRIGLERSSLIFRDCITCGKQPADHVSEQDVSSRVQVRVVVRLEVICHCVLLTDSVEVGHRGGVQVNIGGVGIRRDGLGSFDDVFEVKGDFSGGVVEVSAAQRCCENLHT